MGVEIVPGRSKYDNYKISGFEEESLALAIVFRN